MMYSENTKPVYNTSSVEQHAYDAEGRRHFLAAYSVQYFDEEIAEAFLEQRGKFVVPYKGIQVPERPGEELMWLANATGNPFADAKIERKRWDKRIQEYEFYKVDNPKRKARTVRRKMKGKTELLKAEQGNFYEQRKHPGTDIVFPPYTRHPFPKSIAKWMLRRDMNQDDEAKHGDIVVCDAPAEFEPNESWEGEDIQVYGAMLSEKIDWLKKWPVNKEGLGDDERARIKQDLLHAVYFLLIDERYQKPTMQAFDRYKAELLGDAA